MKSKLVSAASAACLVLFFLVSTGFSGNNENDVKINPGSESTVTEDISYLCPLVTLSSPPSTVLVRSYTCGTIGTRSCSNSFTLTNGSCAPYTWVFTNTTTGWTCTYTSSGTTLTAWISGSTGDNITLVITDAGSGTSPTYSFTGVGC